MGNFLRDKTSGAALFAYRLWRMLGSEGAGSVASLYNQVSDLVGDFRLGIGDQHIDRVEQKIRHDERCRLGRDLHDSTAQLLVALQLRMSGLRARLADTALDSDFTELSQAIAELHREIRALSNGDNELDIPEGKLPDMLREMAQRFGSVTGTSVSVQIEQPYMVLPRATRAALFRVAQEALANACWHGQARSIAVQLRSTPVQAKLCIRDDGLGMPTCPSEGCGIANMRRRIRGCGGRLTIRRLSPGTSVEAIVPASLR